MDGLKEMNHVKCLQQLDGIIFKDMKYFLTAEI